MLGRIDALPAVQVEGLRAAFGLGERPVADRFLVGLATLTLMAEAADGNRLLCLVDDAHWLDRESAAALAFACRRLDAEGIVVVFAARDAGSGEEAFPPAGGVLRLTGLDDATAAALADRHRPGLAPHVRDRLVAMSGGNPLAVLELSAALDHAPPTEQMRPQVIDADASPVGRRIVAAFARQVADLPAAAGRLLLVAAADDTGDAALVLNAARRLGAGLADLAPAERAGLVRVAGEALRFRHPLIRSAVYGRFSTSDRVEASLRLLVGDADGAVAHMQRIITTGRERGLIGGLTHMLLVQTEAALAAGRLREALAAGTEGLRIAEDTGQEHSASNLRGMLARVAAMTGDEEMCLGMAEASLRYAGTHRTTTTAACSALALCVHDLAHRRYASAFDRLHEHGTALRRHPYFIFLTPPDEIEAAVRSGRADRVAGLLDRYEAFTTRHQDRPVAHAIAARCRALLSPDDAADGHFQRTIGLHERVDRPLARARTELLYGEWLRRAHRRNDSRDHLRWALRAYERAGAAVWAQRARSELRATGETVAADERCHDLDRLTPQELQVARLAATGLTNRDIGARLFLSPARSATTCTRSSRSSASPAAPAWPACRSTDRSRDRCARGPPEPSVRLGRDP